MSVNQNDKRFDLYTLFAEEKYSEFEIDRYTFDAHVSDKEKKDYNYDAHEMLPHILVRQIEQGDNELERLLEINSVENLHNEGDEINNIIAEDWVIEGENCIAVGQSCCQRYKPLRGGIPYDIRQALYFHAKFERSVKYKGEKRLTSPHTVSIGNEITDSLNPIEHDEFEIIVRKLDREKRGEATFTDQLPDLY